MLSNKKTSFDCGDLHSPEATTHLWSGVRIYFYIIGWRLTIQSHLSISVIERGVGNNTNKQFPSLSLWIAAINPFSVLTQRKVITNRFMIIVSWKLIKNRSRHSLMISFLISRFLSSEQCQTACIPLWR